MQTFVDHIMQEAHVHHELLSGAVFDGVLFQHFSKVTAAFVARVQHAAFKKVI
jgi:hypothetical protein